ncbi:hypothetical protein Fleli_1629 [Bernardetia litoralis DSM 6794]|uniref:Uncharacterized protein n=1 Tax=Bernardetia litoralis (strain ATCC 23117 / DSM 6794 / NBRC 15988 / NCIMB 1366 / Fx l1 / Sio-4) TaxID=880071 RepID=I4AJA8_BERLS|nr:hypothetical protein Fleli_1629 [Bernardetia litoralis DSM 6794]
MSFKDTIYPKVVKKSIKIEFTYSTPNFGKDSTNSAKIIQLIKICLICLFWQFLLSL